MVVVVAAGEDDAVRVGAAGDLVDVAEHVVADDPPPLAGLQQRAGVVGVADRQPRARRPPRVDDVRLSINR